MKWPETTAERIRFLQWLLAMHVFAIVLCVTGAILGRSPWPLTGIGPNATGLLLSVYCIRREQRRLRGE